MAAPTKSKAGSEVTVQQQLFLFGILIVGIGIVFYMMFYVDAAKKIDRMEIETQTIDVEIAKLEESKQLMNETQEEALRLEQRFKILKQKLPATTDELNYFLSSISQRAQNAKVSKWELFRQEGLEERGEVSAVPIRMEFLATFQGGTAFFWELSDMGNEQKNVSKEQIVNVRRLTISRPQKKDPKKDIDADELNLKFTCIAETYLYTGLKNAKKKGKKGNKRGKR